MKKNIISTYHHSFAGGSKNTSRLLHYLSKKDCNIEAFFFETPQYFTYTESSVITHIQGSDGVHSEVIEPNTIKNYSITDKIIQKIKCSTNPILFGANLFPYCNILLDAKMQVQHLCKTEPKLIIHPVGSDIWQVGTQIKSRVKWMLENHLVNKIVTYSTRFITEIQDYFNIEREINVLPPVLESNRFYPLGELEIAERRKTLGLNDNVFIIHHHSSMRRIKCPEIVIEIAQKAAQLISEKCVLIMTGPIPQNEIFSLNLNLVSLSEDSVFSYKTELNNLTIFWTGILSDVEYLLQVSDVELNVSLHDSFNLSLMEAMACAVPVVTSDTVGIGQHIIKADAGFCFPTKPVKIDELNNLLKSPDSKKHLFDIDYAINTITSIANNRTASRLNGRIAAKYVAEEFSFEKVAKVFYELIK